MNANERERPTCDLCQVEITEDNQGTTTSESFLCIDCLNRLASKMEEECQG